MAAALGPYPNLSNLSPSAAEDAPGGFGATFEDADYQADLVRNGYVVIPTALGFSPQMLAQVNDAFNQHFRESPELRNPRPEDPTWKNVLGAFSALGNPSSFHHPFLRKMREMCEAAVLDADALPLKGRRLEQCFDRAMRRIPGETMPGESWHRDEALHTLPGDDIFGGWINMDSESQYFSCAPGTHHDVGTQNNGFAEIKDPAEKARYRQLANAHGRVEIPPGHIIIFYERIVHEVLHLVATRIMKRLFLGWRVTTAREPLFGMATTQMWIDRQMPAVVKSGQQTAIYPTAYYNFTRFFPKLTAFSTEVFVPQCLYAHTVKQGAQKNTVWMRVERYMKGLGHYGLPLHAPYDVHEVKVLVPSSSWQLYTFDSPSARVGFRAVPSSIWQAYSARAFVVDAQGRPTRRPRPIRVEG